jgi:hypothetical protein
MEVAPKRRYARDSMMKATHSSPPRMQLRQRHAADGQAGGSARVIVTKSLNRLCRYVTYILVCTITMMFRMAA